MRSKSAFDEISTILGLKNRKLFNSSIALLIIRNLKVYARETKVDYKIERPST